MKCAARLVLYPRFFPQCVAPRSLRMTKGGGGQEKLLFGGEGGRKKNNLVGCGPRKNNR